jgi:broad specificity phosphatase PhoE
MTTFHLIRHGERDTPPGFLPGHAPGIRLTAEGRAQAERIARRLAAEKIDQIFTSPLERTVESATPLARLQQLTPQPAPAFIELDFGHWTGKRTDELKGDPRWEHFNRFRSGTRMPEGESAFEVQARFVGELLRLRDAFPGQSIACFSHADPIRLALAYFIGMPIDCGERLEIRTGSISTLLLADWGARLTRLNEVPA